MADITRRRTGELLRKLFEILMLAPDGLKAKDALTALAAQVQLSDYEAGEYPNGGGRRFDKIVRFATVDTTKAGWLTRSSSAWSGCAAGSRRFSWPKACFSTRT